MGAARLIEADLRGIHSHGSRAVRRYLDAMDLGSIGKANPPFRAPDDCEALWAGLADGTIDVVASDHVPRKRATKEKGIWQASQGFPGTATILPVLLSEGYHKGRLDLRRIAQLVTSAPAEIFGIDKRKGFLAPGASASANCSA